MPMGLKPQPDLFDLPSILPKNFSDWFKSNGWTPRDHQLKLLENANYNKSTLLIAPTGAGKTLAGFLPSLVDIYQKPKKKPGQKKTGIHTLYISPLKALAIDIKRNLEMPISQMNLDISLETRTGDTPQYKRQRQKLAPPDILLSTPEQLSLLLASKDAARFFEDLKFVIFDELHSLITSKRGHLLSLALARLYALKSNLQTIGLSATVSNPEQLCRWLVPQNQNNQNAQAELIEVRGGEKPNVTILKTNEHIPWAGHSAKYAMQDIYQAIQRHKMSLLFVNTRSQAEILFQELWRINEDTLPIALHHGSLDVSQRRRVEAAMAGNALRAVIATSTLDLGIDWGDVDLVVHVGAPKGASRLAQRIGRSNHRMDEPSRAILVPANQFEVLECQAALDANYLGFQDTPLLQQGTLDVLAQHILATAVAGDFTVDDLYSEIVTALPYKNLDKQDFENTVQFVSSGGYALKTYERFAKIRQKPDGKWALTHPKFAQQYRLNAGTIIEAPMLVVRMTKATRKQIKSANSFRGGIALGKIEEGFVEALTIGDTFVFSGRIVRFEGIRENNCYVSNAEGGSPKVPAYVGGKFPLSTFLAEKVRTILSSPDHWKKLPKQVSEWLRLQQRVSKLPGVKNLMIETFPRADQFYLVMYPFEGRLAHQTLGMLLTRRMERAAARPLGFVATDYALAIWGLRDFGHMIKRGELSLSELLDEDMLGDDLEVWLDESFMLKRTFRQCATIAGLIEKRHPGKEKSGRQMTISSDLIYDVLREHEPEHILLKATRQDAAHGLLDVKRLGIMLKRIKGNIEHQNLDEISPLAVPVMLEIGREIVNGDAQDALLDELSIGFINQMAE